MTQQNFKVSLQGRMRRPWLSWCLRTSLRIVKLAQFRRIHQGFQLRCSAIREIVATWPKCVFISWGGIASLGNSEDVWRFRAISVTWPMMVPSNDVIARLSVALNSGSQASKKACFVSRLRSRGMLARQFHHPVQISAHRLKSTIPPLKQLRVGPLVTPHWNFVNIPELGNIRCFRELLFAIDPWLRAFSGVNCGMRVWRILDPLVIVQGGG
jgi:hypothetical protein